MRHVVGQVHARNWALCDIRSVQDLRAPQAYAPVSGSACLGKCVLHIICADSLQVTFPHLPFKTLQEFTNCMMDNNMPAFKAALAIPK